MAFFLKKKKYIKKEIRKAPKAVAIMIPVNSATEKLSMV
jgi:hypothetical protein